MISFNGSKSIEEDMWYIFVTICSVAKQFAFDMLINSREMAGELTEVYI